MRDRLSLRWKLTIATWMLSIASLLILYTVASRSIQRRVGAMLQQQLMRDALLAREIIVPATNGLHEHEIVDAMCKQLAKLTSIRLTVIDRSGVVLGDSWHDPKTMVNHRHRPEVAQAIESDHAATASRSSATIGRRLIYCAVPVVERGKVVGVIRTAAPIEEFYAEVGYWRHGVIAALALAGLGALLLSVWLSGRWTRPLVELAQTATALAAGKSEARSGYRSNDEVGELVRTFNTMADELGQRMETIRRDADRAHAILSNMADGIIVVGARGKVEQTNPAAERMFRMSPGTAAGRQVAECTLNYELAELVAAVLRDGEARSGIVAITAPPERTLRAIVTSARAGQELQGAVVVLHDITQSTRIDKMRADFVSNASHELRTPVANLRAMSETLLDGGLDDPALAARFLQSIATETARLGALIEDLLQLSRIESSARPMHMEWVPLAAFLEEFLPAYEERALTRRQSLEVLVGDDIRVWADGSALQQVFANLFDNALKYTPEDGTITVSASRDDAGVSVTVADTGIGIPEPDLARIFERFYRVDKTRSRELGGTGLGLSIVRHLVETHAGRVSVRSKLGMGSEFEIWFPAPGDTA